MLQASLALWAGHKTTEAIVLQFSESLNAGDAQKLGDYSLVTVAKTKKQKSRPVALAKASYNSFWNRRRINWQLTTDN